MPDSLTASIVFEKYAPAARLQLATHSVRIGGFEPAAFVDPKLPMDARLFYLYHYINITQDLSDLSVAEEVIFIGNLLLWTTYRATDSSEQHVMSTVLPTGLHPLEMLKDGLLISTYITFSFLHTIARCYLQRAKDTQNLDDVDITISLCRRCISIQSDGALVPAVEALLCSALATKFKWTSDIETINEAILRGKASLHGKHDQLPLHAQSLTLAWYFRFLRYKSTGDLENGITLLRSVISIAKEDSSATNVVQALHMSLQCLLRTKSLYTMESPLAVELADECIAEARQLIADAPSEYEYHMLLVGGLLRRFGVINEFPDIDEAILTLRKLQDEENGLTSVQQSEVMEELGKCLHQRGAISGSMEDLENSLAFMRTVLRSLPYAKSDRAMVLKANMAYAHYKLYQGRGGSSDLQSVLDYGNELGGTWTMNTGGVRVSIKLITAELNHREKHYESAMHDYIEALEDMPRRLILGRQYQKQSLENSRWPDVGADAAAACIACGHYRKALEVLEVSRSIGWTRSLQMRSKLDQLTADHPEYAERFKQLSASLEAQELSQMVVETDSRLQRAAGLNDEPPWEQRLTLSKRWDSVLSEIRKLPGYEDFLGTPKYDQLKHVSENGPVVVLNCSQYRSDAFILTQSTLDRPQVVSLPKYLYWMAEKWSDTLLRGIESMEDGGMTGPLFSRFVLRPILIQLWRSIVQPIRNSLNSLAPYARRIWWCPTGQLTFLPLHLVTNGLNNSDTASQLIPSHIITLASLLRARSSLKRRHPVSSLVVGCSGAEGYNVIPGTKKEIQCLARISAGVEMSILEGPDATVKQVLCGMSEHSWLHLACHGIQSADEPYLSHFVLEDGPLYMADIVSAQLERPNFAFLSACHTAHGIPVLRDEAMHLAAGLHFAGYCGTIATMWSIDDQIARKLAKKVYSFLYRNPNSSPDVEEAAEALWRAVWTLKEHNASLYLLAPFIHIGV